MQLQAVYQRGVPAVLPSQLERINRGTSEQIGKSHLICFIRSGGKSCKTFSIGSAGFLALVPERHLQARVVGCTDSRQPGCGAEDSKEMSGRPSDVAADGGGGKQIPGSRRPPGEVDREARDLRGHGRK